MADRTDFARYRANLVDELNASALYDGLAKAEADPRIAEVYGRLAQAERKHAEAWAERLREAGQPVPEVRPSWRTRTLIWMARRFGVAAVLPQLAAIEEAASSQYATQPGAKGMAATERSHAIMFRQLGQTTTAGLDGGAVARLEGRHRSSGGNALRAAVLGASDGLLSNFNLVMGVAGASLAGRTILVTGLAGLLAGAVSMALGEWISVQSSRESYQKQIATEQEEILAAPEEEIEELVLIYQARGLDEASARVLATSIMARPDTAIDTLARDELGIDPSDLGGSAWEAALASFLLFAAGAAIPVIPYLFATGVHAIVISALASAVGLFLLGAAITLFTGKSVLWSGLRQVGFGLAAAACVFTIGHLVGVHLGG